MSLSGRYVFFAIAPGVEPECAGISGLIMSPDITRLQKVAQPGLEPGTPDYEPGELPLLYRAMFRLRPDELSSLTLMLFAMDATGYIIPVTFGHC